MQVARKRYTAEQIKLSQIVESLGLEVTLEEPRGKYWLDIYLPEINAGIEYDGPLHFGSKRDARRDQELWEQFGIRILRVSDLKDPELIQKLEDFIDAGNDRATN